MKRLFLKLTCTVTAIIIAASLTACSGDSSSNKEPVTTAAQTMATEPQTTSVKDLKKETDLTKLYKPDTKKDRFAGYWKITEGTGSQLKSFIFCFDGSGRSFMLIGTMGYRGGYEIKEKDGKSIFSSQMTFGLDGDFTYEFSKDDSSVVLTNTADSSKSTMVRTESYNSIPKAEKNPVIDEKLLGAWKDDTGAYLYFGKDGIMYSAQKNINFTFYTYSAADGKIKAVSAMTEPIEDEFTYKLDDNTLVFNRYNYKKISADELV